MTTETTTHPNVDPTDSSDAPKLTYAEAMEDLTGYEELAVTARFEVPIDDLPLSMQLRALMYVQKIRAGVEKKDAHKQVMAMRVREFSDYFTPAEDPDAEGNDEQSE